VRRSGRETTSAAPRTQAGPSCDLALAAGELDPDRIVGRARKIAHCRSVLPHLGAQGNIAQRRGGGNPLAGSRDAVLEMKRASRGHHSAESGTGSSTINLQSLREFDALGEGGNKAQKEVRYSPPRSAPHPAPLRIRHAAMRGNARERRIVDSGERHRA